MPSSFTVSGPPGADGATGATGPGFLTDTQANRPAAATAGAGAVFIPSDGYPPARSTGAAWVVQHPLGFACSNPPSAGSFTKVGSDAQDTLVADGDGLLLTSTGKNSTSLYGSAFVVALPAAPYTFTVGLDINSLYPLIACAVGLVLTDGTGTGAKNATFAYTAYTNGVPYFACSKLSALNTYVADYKAVQWFSKLIFLRIRDDNTNRYYEFSTDGRNWFLFYSVGRTDYLTPTHAGLRVQQATNALATTLTAAQARIFHWSLA